MFPFKLGLILTLFFSALAIDAQTLRRKGSRRPARAETPYFRFGLELATWQETMTMKSQGYEAHSRTQSDGALIVGKWVTPMGSWNRFFGGEFGLGKVKGKGSTAEVPDELNDQPWFLLGALGGYTYRPSPVSELGVSVSALYRRINWKLESGSDLEVESKPFSLGLSGHYIILVSRTSSVQVNVTHHHFWNATMWSLGYMINFR